MQFSKLFLPEVIEAIEQGDVESLRTVFENLHPSDIAELVNTLTPENVSTVVRILRFPKGFEVFEQLDLQIQAKVLDHLGRQETIKILEELSADDRVDLIQKLPEQTVESLLPFMAQAERDDIRRLLQYGENTAGAIMTTEYAHLTAETTVAEALSMLRQIAPDTETIYYIYVTDQDRRLLGFVSLKDLVLARPTQIVREIMSQDLITTSVDMDQEEVARDFEKYDFLAIPVVDKESRLVGIITYDDAVDVMMEEQTEDVHRLGAVEPLEDPYFQSSFWELARKRAFWLLILFFGQFLTFAALRHYQETLDKALALMLFLPLVLSSGGNSGSQSVTLITRALAIGDVRSRDFLRVMARESAMGLALGAFLSFIGIFWCRLLWDLSWNVSLSVGFSLIGVVTVGALIGALLPLGFKKLGFDPAIMSSPFVSSILDTVGVVILFTIAQALI